jgi:threonine synthase
MGVVQGLKCRECGTLYPPTFKWICSECFGPLDVIYNYDSIRLDPSLLEARGKNQWRYFELLPIKDRRHIVDLGVGYTPLLKADRLGERLGLKNLYLKNDSVNPTFSFKDRPSSVAVSKALELGLRAVGCASTGNLAAAMAAHATRAGLPSYIFVPHGIEPNKIIQAASYGGEVITIRGNYDDVNRLATEVGETFQIGVVNVNLRPYYVEGSKTLALEVVEQLGWQVPDYIVVPVASGALLCAIFKGLSELVKVGLLKDNGCKPIAAQPKGCAPVVDAFKAGREFVTPVEEPKTIAKSLAIGDPGDGIYALRLLKTKGGLAEAVGDDEVVEAVRLLASTEGIFTEPAGGVSVGVLKRLVEEGAIDRDATVVCLITGNGLKAPDAVAPTLPRPRLVESRLEAVAPLISG